MGAGFFEPCESASEARATWIDQTHSPPRPIPVTPDNDIHSVVSAVLRPPPRPPPPPRFPTRYNYGSILRGHCALAYETSISSLYQHTTLLQIMNPTLYDLQEACGVSCSA